MKELKRNEILLVLSEDKKSVKVSLGGGFYPTTFACCPKRVVKHIGDVINAYLHQTGVEGSSEWEPGECCGEGYADCERCMTEFANLWDTEVKQLAEACVTEPKFIQLMCKGAGYKQTDEEKTYMEEMYAKYKDLPGMYRISEMIWRVEHELVVKRLPMARLAIREVYTVLNRPSYFQDVFKGNENDEEWKKRADLRDGLRKILDT